MPTENFNIKSKDKDTRGRKIAVYTVCTMVLILCVLLDIYFIGGIFGS